MHECIYVTEFDPARLRKKTRYLDSYLSTDPKYELAVRELFVGDHPEKVDVKRIKGKRNEYYRMRIGDYRVVYALINGIIVVVKTMVAGARGDAYKKMDGLK